MNKNYLKKGETYHIEHIDNDITLVNFPINSSVKVLPFFNKFGSKEIDNLRDRINEICDIELRVEDYLGKILLIAFYFLFGKADMVIINTAGLSEQSIVFLERNLQIITRVLNKVALINR